MKKIISKLNKLFAPKTRAEIIESKIAELTQDIFMCGFSNYEIATILNTTQGDVKAILKHRKAVIEKELLETTQAINTL